MEKLRCFYPGTVELLDSTEKYSAIHELIQKASVFGELSSLEELERAVLWRESISSTGLGSGVAMAHGRTSGVQTTLVALGISRKGIAYNSIDGKPVHFLFLIANPPTQQTEYILTLSTLARIINNKKFRNEILDLASTRHIEERFSMAFEKWMTSRKVVAAECY
ncbi:MAG: PTS sugar transporter subunit IIA [Spirochaetales bacterium]|nr:PTS sugar transporter subunit IIA [Spirochaetales bacterium]